MKEFAVTRVRTIGQIETKYMYCGTKNPNLAQYNQIIFDAFGMPRLTDVFIISNTYTNGRVEQFAIRDGKYA